MSVQLVLIRHGIAEDSVPGQDDFSRCLTGRGEQVLHDTFPQLFPLLEKSDETLIWSSPLIRAAQTAKIAADTLGITQIAHYDFISEGNFGDLWRHLAALDMSKQHTVIIVGHEPTMGDWSYELSGAYLPFKKGSAACFRLDTNRSGTGELLWFIQPKSMGNISREIKTDKTLFDIQEVLLGRVQNIRTAEEAFLRDSNDIENVHQLRVNIRILRSLLTFVKPFQKGKQNAFMQETLKNIVRELSYLRELDVLSDACAKFSGLESADLPANSGFLDVLRQEREAEAERVINTFFAVSSTYALHEMEKELHQIAWREKLRSKESIPDLVRVRFADLYEDFIRDISGLDYSDAPATHAIRKRAKILRYILNSMAPWMEHGYEKAGDELRRMQTNLGELCDARRNRDILQKFDQQAFAPSIHAELQALIAYQNQIISEKLDRLV